MLFHNSSLGILQRSGVQLSERLASLGIMGRGVPGGGLMPNIANNVNLPINTNSQNTCILTKENRDTPIPPPLFLFSGQ